MNDVELRSLLVENNDEFTMSSFLFTGENRSTGVRVNFKGNNEMLKGSYAQI